MNDIGISRTPARQRGNCAKRRGCVCDFWCLFLCQLVYAPRKIMEFSSRLRALVTTTKENGALDPSHYASSLSAYTSPSMRRRYHCRHLDRRQKTKRPPTNNALAWLTRAILMRRILEFRRTLVFPGDSRLLGFLVTPHSPHPGVPVPFYIHASIARVSALPSCISEKRRACKHREY